MDPTRACLLSVQLLSHSLSPHDLVTYPFYAHQTLLTVVNKLKKKHWLEDNLTLKLLNQGLG